MTATARKTARPRFDPRFASRILEEGYGPGAWHGPDLKAAIADVPAAAALWRPGPERHNIAEIALHHAWCISGVIGSLTGEPGAPFPYKGEDWFVVPAAGRTWNDVTRLLDTMHERLVTVVEGIGSGRVESPLAEEDRFRLILGVTCHAIYHAGQIQLIKVMNKG